MTHRARAAALLSISLACPAAVAAAQEEPVRYEGHRVVRAQIQKPADLTAVLALTDDVWTHDYHPGAGGLGPLDVRLSPEAYGALVDLGVRHEVMIADVQALIDAERARIGAGNAAGAGWYEEFKTNAEIVERIGLLAGQHPALATTGVIGASLEGREIHELRMKGLNAPADAPVLLINGCLHAREWISPMTTMFVAESLLTGYGSDPRITAVMDAVEFVFVPMSNPDGYVYSWDVNRLWRKNRRDNQGSDCWGVDLNRNFGYQWGLNDGSSGDPCSQVYRGAAPFSEPETVVLRDLCLSLADRLVANIDVHSYGQLILSPWGYTTEPPPDAKLFDVLNGKMQKAIGGVHQKFYKAGQGSVILYLVSGGSRDWTYGVLGSLGWTFELRDTGQHGFILPADQIIPTSEETLEGVLALAESMATVVIGLAEPLPGHTPSGGAFTAKFLIESLVTPLDGSSPTLWSRPGGGAFVPTPLVDSGGGVYEGVVMAAPCGKSAEFYVTAKAQGGGVATFPELGALAPLKVQTLDVSDVVDDTCEVNIGWVVGAADDDATTGIWELADPEGTAAQPSDDHTPWPGVKCWVTGAKAGNGIGDFDVDNGKTTLTSYAFDATNAPGYYGAEAVLVYHRWYSNDKGANPNTDSMPIHISNDDGKTWTLLEDVKENANAWVRKEFVIGMHAEPTSQMRVRFVARDDAPGSIVEACVDDVRVFVRGCTTHPADLNGDGKLDLFDFLAFVNLFNGEDPAADFDGDGKFTLFDFLAFVNAFNG